MHGIMDAFGYSIVASFLLALPIAFLCRLPAPMIAVAVVALLLICATMWRLLIQDPIRIDEIMLLVVALVVAGVGMAGSLAGAAFGITLRKRLLGRGD